MWWATMVKIIFKKAILKIIAHSSDVSKKKIGRVKRKFSVRPERKRMRKIRCGQICVYDIIWKSDFYDSYDFTLLLSQDNTVE